MKAKKHYLFCPGPVNIAPNVKKAVNNEIGHREKEFSTLLESINANLLNLFDESKNSNYYPVFLTGSGTAINESVLSSLPDNINPLVISNGEFGERLYEISKLHNPNSKILKFAWAQEIDLGYAEEYIKQSNPDVIIMVHHETSTGMLNPIDKIGRIVKKYNKLFIVDAISSVGAEKIKLENWNITFCTGTAGKAIGSLPGVAFVIGKKTEFEKLKYARPKTMYMNLYNLYKYSKDLSQTPNTPAVQLFFSLNQALENILKEGFTERRMHIKEMTQLLRSGMKTMGLNFLIDEKQMCSVLTTVKLPEFIEFEKLSSQLKARNIIVYNGKGPLKDKVFQVGNIGSIDKDNVLYFLSNLQKVINEFKVSYNLKLNFIEQYNA